MTEEVDEAKYATILEKYKPRPIHDEAENRRATNILERLYAHADLSPEHAAIAELITTLVEKFEQRYALKKRRAGKHSGSGSIANRNPAPSAAGMRARNGYSMPTLPASRGPISQRPGSALPRKAAKQ
jgi:hypothetical protein